MRTKGWGGSTGGGGEVKAGCVHSGSPGLPFHSHGHRHQMVLKRMGRVEGPGLKPREYLWTF